MFTRQIRVFDPRYAIVTGSNSGIGRETAIALAEAGMDVGITWNSDPEGAEQTARLVRAEGRRAIITQLDTSNLEACGDEIDNLAKDLGGLDVFVNNAGLGQHTPFLRYRCDFANGRCRYAVQWQHN